MASYNRYIGDGSTTEFVVNFDLGFLSRTHVHVEVDQVPVGFTWLSDGLVDITPAPESDAVVVIYRRSPQDAPVHSFKDSSILIESNIDEQNIHALMRAQEAEDINNIGGNTLEGLLDEARQHAEDAEDSAERAAASETAAAASSSEAATSAANAASSADDAEQYLNVFREGGERFTSMEAAILSNVPVDADVIYITSYYEAVADGVTSYWMRNGVTGQTPSQTPGEIGDLLFNDSAGTQWKFVDTGGTIDARIAGVSTSIQDNGPAMRALHIEPRSVLYPAGVINITGTVEAPFGTAIKTAGYETEFWFSGMTQSTDCFSVVRSPVPQRRRNFMAEPHKIVLVDSDARFGWSTPLSSDVFIYEKPDIQIFCESMAPDRAATVTPYSFESVIRIGDCRSGKVELYGSGGYPTLSDPAGARLSDGITLEGATGNVGVKMVVEFLAAYRGLNIRNGTEGFMIEGEFAQVRRGIDSSEQTLVEPGGFIDNMHINAMDKGVILNNRAEISIGALTTYKSDAFFDDGVSEWIGVQCTGATSARIDSVGCFPGVTFAKARNIGLTFEGGTGECQYTHVDTRNCGTITKIDSADTVTCGTAHSVNGAVGYNIDGAVKNITLGRIDEAVADLITDFVVMGASVPRGQVYYDQRSLEKESYSASIVSAAGSKEVSPISDSQQQNFIVQTGSGAYTYDIVLNDEDTAVVGSRFDIKVNMPSSSNPTVRVVRKSDSAVLSTMNVASQVRLVHEYLFTVVTFERISIFESAELLY